MADADAASLGAKWMGRRPRYTIVQLSDPHVPADGLLFGRVDAVARVQAAIELIDAAGCRGLILGGATVSEKHCNFLINTGTATADDIESLGEELRHRVKSTTGVTLTWEIRRIGVPLVHAEDAV